MAFKRIRRTFQYEPDIPDDYTEHGVEKGAKAEDGKIDSPDMVRIVSETRGMTLDEVFVWLSDHDMQKYLTTSLNSLECLCIKGKREVRGLQITSL